MNKKEDTSLCDCCEPGCLRCSKQKAEAEDEAEIAHALHLQDINAQELEDLKSDGFVDNDDGDEEDPLGSTSR